MNEHPYWWTTTEDGWRKRPEPAGSCGPVDIAIVGAGYTGLTAAWQLTRAGATVVVIEQEQVGWGASSRNAGQVLTGLRVGPATLIARFGEAGARALFADSLAAIEGLEALVAGEKIDCEYSRTGHVQAASKPAHFDAFREEQALLGRVFGHAVTVVPRADQRAEVGSDRYHGLLVDERSGALNPAKYVRGLAAAAARGGAVIREGTRVTRTLRAGTRWRLATTTGEIDAGDVLLATDAYTDAAAPALRRRLVPVGSHVIATAVLGSRAAGILPRHRMAFDSKHFLHYFRLTSDNRLLFGGRAEFREADAHPGRAAAILERDMAAVFPQLAGIGIDYSWSGNVAFTIDEMPRAGRLEGLWYAGGYGGHGIAMATHLGSLIARRMAGEPIEHPFFDDKFRPIPLYSGRPWFLPILGAYYAIRDLIE